jgi:hypothetical protein
MPAPVTELAPEILSYPGPVPRAVLSGAPPLPPMPSYRGDFSDPVQWLYDEIKRALTADGVESPRLREALDRIGKNKAVFAAGLLDGLSDGLVHTINMRLDLLRQIFVGLFEFYSLVYDPVLYLEMIRIWTQEPNAGVKEFGITLQKRHPNAYKAGRAYAAVTAKLEEATRRLRQDKGTYVVARDFFLDVAEALHQLVSEERAKFVRLTDVHEQGRLLGNLVGRAIAEAVLLLLDLKMFIRDALKLGERARSWANTQAKITQRWAATQKAAAGLKHLGDELADAYKAATARIEPYTPLRNKTGTFNRSLADFLTQHAEAKTAMGGLDLPSRAWRLDAHHIAEGRGYEAFKAEFKSVFQWNKAEDMHAVPIEYELHGRSGEGLAKQFHMDNEFFVNRKSLTDQLEDYIGPINRTRYKNVQALFEKYRSFYRDKYPRLYRTTFDIPKPDGTWTTGSLEKWFEDRIAELKAAGLWD